MSAIRQRLLILRDRLSQAKMANLLGISTQAYQALEAGKNMPSMKVLKSIAQHFDVDMNWLIKGKDDLLIQSWMKITY